MAPAARSRSLTAALLSSSLAGTALGAVETLSSHWAESVLDHWSVLLAACVLVPSLWALASPFAIRSRLSRGIRVSLLGLMVSYAVLGVVQNAAELVSYSAVQGNLGIVFLPFTLTLAVFSVILAIRAWHSHALPVWSALILLLAPLFVTVPLAPILQSLGFPIEAFHILLWVGPLAVALALLRTPASPRHHPTAKPQTSDQAPGEEVVQVNDAYVGGGPPPSRPDSDMQHPTGG